MNSGNRFAISLFVILVNSSFIYSMGKPETQKVSFAKKAHLYDSFILTFDIKEKEKKEQTKRKEKLIVPKIKKPSRRKPQLYDRFSSEFERDKEIKVTEPIAELFKRVLPGFPIPAQSPAHTEITDETSIH